MQWGDSFGGSTLPAFNASGVQLGWSSRWCGGSNSPQGGLVCASIFQTPSLETNGCSVASVSANIPSSVSVGNCSGANFSAVFYWSAIDPIVSMVTYQQTTCSPNVTLGVTLTRASGYSYTLGTAAGSNTTFYIAQIYQGGRVYVRSRSGNAIDQLTFTFYPPATTFAKGACSSTN